jgi:flagellar basal-body rod protein FlgG
VGVDGTIEAVKPDGSSTTVAKLGVDAFPNPEGLEALGEGLYRETEASGAPQAAQNFSVRQGFLEMSNVELAGEMVKLMTAQRAYELAARAVQTADHLLEVATNLRR